MNVLFDTNVMLDALLGRMPWAESANELLRLNDDGEIFGHFIASAVTDVYYISRRLVGAERARGFVAECLRRMYIVEVGYKALRQAWEIGLHDYEDAVQVAAAQAARLEVIVTRNVADFGSLEIEVVSPDELLRRIHGNA